MSEIEFEAVRFAYPDSDPALDGVSLEVEPGEVALLVGGSGSGKSTLLRSVNGLVPHATGGRFGGSVTTAGRKVADHQPRDLADVVGFVHQDPDAHFVVDRVEGDVAFVLENLGMDPSTMRRRVEEVMDALGIADLRDRSPATLSGGERQRCAVAGAIASGPAVLVLDEPTSELDPQGAEDVLAAVQRLNLDLGTTVLMAEHRLERAATLVDRALVLVDGTVAGDGTPGEVLRDYPGAPPVAQLGHLLGWDPIPLTVRDARARVRAMEPAFGETPEPAQPAPVARPTPGPSLLTAAGVGAELGGRPVLGGVDIDVRAGQAWAVLGRNGSGKTTLLRVLADLLSRSSGNIDRHGSVAYVPQDPNTLLFSPTVRAELEETLRLRGMPRHAGVDRMLAGLDLQDLADRHPRSLSAGQRQRVAVAAVAIGGADVLLLDEPTRGIDARSSEALERLVTTHLEGGGAVVVATHDVELAARIADQVMVLAEGEPVAVGDGRTVLSGSLFAPQVLRVLPPFMTVAEVAAAAEGHR